MTFDEIARPVHYNSHRSGVECIAVAEQLGFNLGNAFKYLFRSDIKHTTPVTDLKKALFYVEREHRRFSDAPLRQYPDLDEPQANWFDSAFFFGIWPALRVNITLILKHETSWRAGAMAYIVRGSEFASESDLEAAASYIRKAIEHA